MEVYPESDSDIIHETKVDFVNRPVCREIHLVQYDTSLSIIKVYLYRDGERYVIPDNVDVKIRFCQLDGSEVYKSVLGCNAEKTAVYFDADEIMTSLNGYFMPVLELLFPNSKRACSSPILITIDKNPIKK